MAGEEIWWWVTIRGAESYIQFQGRFRASGPLEALELAVFAAGGTVSPIAGEHGLDIAIRPLPLVSP